MRIFIYIVFLLLGVISHGNGVPTSRAHITEVYFGENFSKTIEIRFDYINFIYDSAYCLFSKYDSAFLNFKPTEPGIYTITYLDLTSPLSVQKSGDSLFLFTYGYEGMNYRASDHFIFGDMTTSRVNAPQQGQSLVGLPDSASMENYGRPLVVKDTCPSLGYEKDPVRGIINGFVYDSLSQPIAYQEVCLEGIINRKLWTDANGYFEDTTVFGMNYRIHVPNEYGGSLYSEFFSVEPDSTTSVAITLPINREINVSGWILPEGLQIMPGSYAIFTPKCPDAPIDTIFTDSSGYFYGVITCGNYAVRFSRENFKPEFFHNFQLIQNDRSFGYQNLDEGNVIEIERGSVSGIWNNNQPYYIFGDINILLSDSLTVNPGCDIIFCGDYSLTVRGSIHAAHTIIYSHSIDKKYNGIKIVGNESFALFEHCSLGSFEELGIYSCSAIFNYCEFSYIGNQILIAGTATPSFFHCSLGEYANRFYCKDDALPLFSNNIFSLPGREIVLISDNACPTFINNTFYHFYTVVWSTSQNAVPVFRNNIFCKCGTPFMSYSGAQLVDFSYNLLYDTEAYWWIPGYGVLTTTNLNGDSCDAYYNLIEMDPFFEAPGNGNFNLLSGSPCIDAGDPDSPYDPDNTIADMGAFFFDQIGIYVKENNELESLYQMKVIPNPNRGDFTISIDSRLDHYYNASLSIYTMNGLLLDSRNIAHINKGENLIRYSGLGKGSMLKNGLFICTLSVAGRTVSSTKVLIIND